MSNIIYDSKSVTLNPSGATQLLNGTAYSDMIFQIDDLIKITSKHVLYNTIKITHAEFPFSFYVINDSNNYLSLSTGNITLEQGNYNAIQFQTYLNSLLPTNMTISLNTITGKFTFTYTQYFYINASSTCGFLGFLNNVYYYSSLNKIVLPNPCNFTLQNLYIKTPNLLLENYNTVSKDYSTLRNIQINTSPFGMILYENKSDSKNLVKNISDVDTLRIQIFDDYGSLVNFNSIPWTITLQVESAIEFQTSKTLEDILNSVLIQSE